MGRRQLLTTLAVAGAVVLVAVTLERSAVDRRRISSTSIVLLGDSITAEGPWEELFPDLPVVNEGHSGFTTEQLVPIAERVARADPAAVIVLTGTNDIRDGHPAAWTRERLATLLDRLASGTDATVVVQTILPRSDAADEVRRANAAIRDEATGRGLRLVDLHPEFDDGTGGLRDTETSDGLHLTRAGYDRWAEVLAPVLRDLAPTAAP